MKARKNTPAVSAMNSSRKAGERCLTRTSGPRGCAERGADDRHEQLTLTFSGLGSSGCPHRLSRWEAIMSACHENVAREGAIVELLGFDTAI